MIKDGIPVYCNHAWDSFGPGTMRCMRCRMIWKKFEIPDEPREVIGHMERSEVTRLPED